tara:strand:+ start:1282 stop:1623 length:342 start_codon:yes stop_codon:yes gene_type:complete
MMSHGASVYAPVVQSDSVFAGEGSVFVALDLLLAFDLALDAARFGAEVGGVTAGVDMVNVGIINNCAVDRHYSSDSILYREVFSELRSVYPLSSMSGNIQIINCDGIPSVSYT